MPTRNLLKMLLGKIRSNNMSTTIEWASNPDGTRGESLNMVFGCTKKSAGCTNCYAELMAKRLRHIGNKNYQTATDDKGWTGKVSFDPSVAEKVSKWRKPRTVFLNSMSDTFHEDLDDRAIFNMLGMIAKHPKHTFILVTKRAERMKIMVNRYVNVYCHGDPLQNMWLLVSAENQKTADERVLFLIATKAIVRGISAEPLLGFINFGFDGIVPSTISRAYRPVSDFIDFVIAGGESGNNARSVNPNAFRNIRDQCVASEVKFFFKQWGAYAPLGEISGLGEKNFNSRRYHIFDSNEKVFYNGKKKNGRLLDGREWNERPEFGCR